MGRYKKNQNIMRTTSPQFLLINQKDGKDKLTVIFDEYNKVMVERRSDIRNFKMIRKLYRRKLLTKQGKYLIFLNLTEEEEQHIYRLLPMRQYKIYDYVKKWGKYIDEVLMKDEVKSFIRTGLTQNRSGMRLSKYLK